MQFLGAINVPYAIAAAIGALSSGSLRSVLLLVVGLANLSQFLKDLHADRQGRWTRRLTFITVVDGAFALVCLALVALLW